MFGKILVAEDFKNVGNISMIFFMSELGGFVD